MADLDWRIPTLPSSDHVEMELTGGPRGHNEPAALAGRIRLVVARTAEPDQLIQSKSEPLCERLTTWWTSTCAGRGPPSEPPWTSPTHTSQMNLPRFGGHPGSHGSAVGVCHGQTQAASIHDGVQGT